MVEWKHVEERGKNMADWRKLKREYISSTITTRELAEKYHVPYSSLAKKSAAEKWAALRKQAEKKEEALVVEKAAEKNSSVESSLQDAALMLLEKAMEGIQAVEKEDSAGMRAYGLVLKSIMDVLNIRTKADMEEQAARIAKLRREAEPEAKGEGAKLEITGLPEEFKV